MDTYSELTEPYEGYPQTGKWEAKVEASRGSIEWSGAIFDTAADAKNWGRRLKAQWVREGADPSYIKIEVSKCPNKPEKDPKP